MLCSGQVPPGLSFLLFHFQYHSLWPLTIAFLTSAFAARRLGRRGWEAVISKGVLPAVTASPLYTLGSIQLPPAPGESWARCLSSSSSETQLRVGPMLWSPALSHQQLETKKVTHLPGVVSPPLRIRVFLVLPLCFCVSWSWTDSADPFPRITDLCCNCHKISHCLSAEPVVLVSGGPGSPILAGYGFSG